MLDFLILLFSLLGIICLIDIAVFGLVFALVGFRVPTRTEYRDHALSALGGVLGGVGFYFLVVIAFCL